MSCRKRSCRNPLRLLPLLTGGKSATSHGEPFFDATRCSAINPAMYQPAAAPHLDILAGGSCPAPKCLLQRCRIRIGHLVGQMEFPSLALSMYRQSETRSQQGSNPFPLAAPPTTRHGHRGRSAILVCDPAAGEISPVDRGRKLYNLLKYLVLLWKTISTCLPPSHKFLDHLITYRKKR